MRFILRIILVGVVVWLLSKYIPEIHFKDATSAIIFVLVFTLLNIIVKPIFILLTIPITIVTLGLFLIFVNAIMILLADYLMSGFSVDGFLWAFIFSIILAVVNYVIESILSPKDAD
jgi:putative membrane protein